MYLFFCLVLSLLSLCLLVPTLVLAIEVAASISKSKAAPCLVESAEPSICVLIPAHNEASGLLATLENIKAQLSTSDRILVVADNCSDTTAQVSVSAGVDVISRQDEHRRGKGYALEFGVEHISHNPPEVVVVIDADCIISAGTLSMLAREARRLNRPVQGLYLMSSPPGSGVNMRIAEFAFTLKNQIRPMGLLAMGLPCQLMGSGMAFPYPLIRTASLGTANIVEDLQLGIELAISGHPPAFLPDVVIRSAFPTDSVGFSSQRTRWEHGHLSVLKQEGFRLLALALKRRDPQLAAIAIDLLVPPLALLSLLLGAAWTTSLLARLLSTTTLPLFLMTIAIAVFGCTVLIAWYREGRQIIGFVALTRVFFYAFRKIPIYLKYVLARQTAWVRSKRDGEE